MTKCCRVWGTICWLVLVHTPLEGYSKPVLKTSPVHSAQKPTPKTPKVHRSKGRAAKAAAKHAASRKISKRRLSKRRVKRDRYPPMVLYNVNSRERMRLRIYDRKGRPIKRSQRRISYLFRCHATQKRHRIHGALIRNLYRIWRHFDGRPIHVISGYRSKSVARIKTSYHTKGMAVDFRIAGVSIRKVRDYIRHTFSHYGLGFYPTVNFIHFDVRRSKAFWIDFSGHGEDPVYAQNPNTVVKNEALLARLEKEVVSNSENSPFSSKKQMYRNDQKLPVIEEVLADDPLEEQHHAAGKAVAKTNSLEKNAHAVRPRAQITSVKPRVTNESKDESSGLEKTLGKKPKQHPDRRIAKEVRKYVREVLLEPLKENELVTPPTVQGPPALGPLPERALVSSSSK